MLYGGRYADLMNGCTA